MDININVKVCGGPRTPVTVKAYSTAVNKRTMRLANHSEVTDTQIAKWIQEQLGNALKELETTP